MSNYDWENLIPASCFVAAGLAVALVLLAVGGMCALGAPDLCRSEATTETHISTPYYDNTLRCNNE